MAAAASANLPRTSTNTYLVHMSDWTAQLLAGSAMARACLAEAITTRRYGTFQPAFHEWTRQHPNRYPNSQMPKYLTRLRLGGLPVCIGESH
ncbi:hypothetical protein LZ32DRAFT_345009 [Colletotrichum eremochloae]|nr:hypothetical protein LZ32DRAFT_345009 [Colletotrichum eremochloae]